jgi:acetyl esterase/lipase
MPSLRDRNNFGLLLPLAFALLGATGTVAAQEPGERFRRLDRNGDGKITRDELPESVRANFDRVDTNRDGSVSAAELATAGPALIPFNVPDSVRHVADVPYAESDNPRQRLDLLVPRAPKSDRPLPVIVFIHGGAWQQGDRSGGLPVLASYVGGGAYAGVTVGYRLTGEAKWPAQAHDCKAALRWIRANAGAYNLDPERIGLIGGSAGGHLVALLGTSDESAHLEGDLGKYAGVSTRVRCVVDQYGPTDFLALDKAPSQLKHDGPDTAVARLLGGAIHAREDVARAASPVTYVTPDDPPFLIIHGTDDPGVPYDQSVRFSAALRKAGVPTLFQTVEGGLHGNFRSPELNRRIGLFFDKYLLGRDVTIPTDPVRPGPAEAPGRDGPGE